MATETKTKTKTLAKAENPGIAKLATWTTDVQATLTAVATALSGPLKTPELAVLFDALKTWGADLEALEKVAKAGILAVLKTSGEAVGKGSLRMETDGWQLEARAQKTGVDEKRLEALLRAKGADPATYMQAEVKYKVSDDGVKRALAVGVLTMDELTACTADPSYAVMKPKPV